MGLLIFVVHSAAARARRVRRWWEWRGYTPGRTYRRVDGGWQKVRNR